MFCETRSRQLISDDPFGPHHLIGDVVGADFGVLAIDGHVLEVAEHFFPLVVGESAADAAQHVKRSFAAQYGHEHVVQQARPVAGRFGEADHGHVQVVPRLDLEAAGGVAADDQPFGPFRLDPLGVQIAHGGGLVDPLAFDRMHARARSQQLPELLPDILERRRRRRAVQRDQIEGREAELLQLSDRAWPTGCADHVLNARAAIFPGLVQLSGDHRLFDSGLREQFRGFVQKGQSHADRPAGIQREHFPLAEDEHREFAVDLPADVELGRGNALRDFRPFQWIEAGSCCPAVVLDLHQQQRIGQRRGRRNAVVGKLDFHPAAVEEGGAHAGFSSAEGAAAS